MDSRVSRLRSKEGHGDENVRASHTCQDIKMDKKEFELHSLVVSGLVSRKSLAHGVRTGVQSDRPYSLTIAAM